MKKGWCYIKWNKFLTSIILIISTFFIFFDLKSQGAVNLKSLYIQGNKFTLSVQLSACDLNQEMYGNSSFQVSTDGNWLNSGVLTWTARYSNCRNQIFEQVFYCDITNNFNIRIGTTEINDSELEFLGINLIGDIQNFKFLSSYSPLNGRAAMNLGANKLKTSVLPSYSDLDIPDFVDPGQMVTIKCKAGQLLGNDQYQWTYSDNEDCLGEVFYTGTSKVISIKSDSIKSKYLCVSIKNNSQLGCTCKEIKVNKPTSLPTAIVAPDSARLGTLVTLNLLDGNLSGDDQYVWYRSASRSQNCSGIMLSTEVADNLDVRLSQSSNFCVSILNKPQLGCLCKWIKLDESTILPNITTNKTRYCKNEDVKLIFNNTGYLGKGQRWVLKHKSSEKKYIFWDLTKLPVLKALVNNDEYFFYSETIDGVISSERIVIKLLVDAMPPSTVKTFGPSEICTGILWKGGVVNKLPNTKYYWRYVFDEGNTSASKFSEVNLGELSFNPYQSGNLYVYAENSCNMKSAETVQRIFVAKKGTPVLLINSHPKKIKVGKKVTFKLEGGTPADGGYWQWKLNGAQIAADTNKVTTTIINNYNYITITSIGGPCGTQISSSYSQSFSPKYKSARVKNNSRNSSSSSVNWQKFNPENDGKNHLLINWNLGVDYDALASKIIGSNYTFNFSPIELFGLQSNLSMYPINTKIFSVGIGAMGAASTSFDADFPFVQLKYGFFGEAVFGFSKFKIGSQIALNNRNITAETTDIFHPLKSFDYSKKDRTYKLFLRFGKPWGDGEYDEKDISRQYDIGIMYGGQSYFDFINTLQQNRISALLKNPNIGFMFALNKQRRYRLEINLWNYYQINRPQLNIRFEFNISNFRNKQ